MSGFFQKPEVLAVGFLAAILGIVQFTVPYIFAPIPVRYSPVIGGVIGLLAAFLVDHLLSKRSQRWSARRKGVCSLLSAVALVVVLVLQGALTLLSDAEIAPSIASWASYVHGWIVRLSGFLPWAYGILVAFALYFAKSAVYWFYRWTQVE